MEQFFELLQQKKNNGELDIAIDQCKKSMQSFVRSYVAYASLKGWECEDVIYRFNKQILDSMYKEEDLKREIEFYKNSLSYLNKAKQQLAEKDS